VAGVFPTGVVAVPGAPPAVWTLADASHEAAAP
jgi:hypothetical protein